MNKTTAVNIEILDTTLRDGAQGEGVSFSLLDKLAVVKTLVKQGIPLIEAGNPASNPKDMEFFTAVRSLNLGNSHLCAFGATRKKNSSVTQDANLHSLLEANTHWVSIFGKCWDLHVRDVLQTTNEENLAMIADTVAYFKAQGRQVIFDAEHFYDGCKQNPDYAMAAVTAAWQAGADRICLCDTNGGCFPDEVFDLTARVVKACPVMVGVHTHNDTGCAVANSMAAVAAGARQVQGTYIGFGERCGNANLSTVIANLQLKRGMQCVPPEKLVRLTKTARQIAEIANQLLPEWMPYVGKSAFSHKGGMHVDGIYKNSLSFEHISPELVGNRRNILISEFAGRSAVVNRIMALDSTVTRDSQVTEEIIEKLKLMEYEGYAFESAEASFEIFALKQLNKYHPAFTLEYFKTIGEQPALYVDRSCSVIIKLRVGQTIEMTSAEGDGPVHALDIALRKALEVFYPVVSAVRLVDYKVRVMETKVGTAAKVRVLIESSDGEHNWTTVGLSSD
ncbi:MAG: citramalate synthase, partial [Angelakisella sp.]